MLGEILNYKLELSLIMRVWYKKKSTWAYLSLLLWFWCKQWIYEVVWSIWLQLWLDRCLFKWIRIRIFMIMYDLSEFLVKYIRLGQTRWIIEVRCVSRLKKGVKRILPNLVYYGKCHLFPWEVSWIGYVNKWLYGRILSVRVKKNIEYWVRLIMKLFCIFRAKIRSFKGGNTDYGLWWSI